MRPVGRRILAFAIFALSLATAGGTASAQSPNLLRFYLGGQLGYSWDDVDISTIPPAAFVDPGNFGGIIGGLHLGGNFLKQDNVILGIVADFNWLNANTSSTAVHSFPCVGDGEFEVAIDAVCIQNFAANLSIDVEWKASLRAKASMFLAPNALVYATAGIAFAGLDATATVVPPGLSASDSETLVGFVVGGGAEFFVTPDVSLFSQVLYYNFGSDNLHLLATNVNVDLDEIVVQGGVSFYLN